MTQDFFELSFFLIGLVAPPKIGPCVIEWCNGEVKIVIKSMARGLQAFGCLSLLCRVELPYNGRQGVKGTSKMSVPDDVRYIENRYLSKFREFLNGDFE